MTCPTSGPLSVLPPLQGMLLFRTLSLTWLTPAPPVVSAKVRFPWRSCPHPTTTESGYLASTLHSPDLPTEQCLFNFHPSPFDYRSKKSEIKPVLFINAFLVSGIVFGTSTNIDEINV